MAADTTALSLSCFRHSCHRAVQADKTLNLLESSV